MSLTFAFDEKLTGENKGGGNFPRFGHAYIAEITEVGENKGWLNIEITGSNYTAGDYDKLSTHTNSPYLVEWVKKIANNVIASNEVMKGAIGKDSLDLSKWNGAGLKIGVVYGQQFNYDKDKGEEVPTRFVEPKYTIPVDQVADWEVDQKAYNEFMAEWYPDAGKKTEEAPKQEAPKAETPVDEELPF